MFAFLFRSVVVYAHSVHIFACKYFFFLNFDSLFFASYSMEFIVKEIPCVWPNVAHWRKRNENINDEVSGNDGGGGGMGTNSAVPYEIMSRSTYVYTFEVWWNACDEFDQKNENERVREIESERKKVLRILSTITAYTNNEHVYLQWPFCIGHKCTRNREKSVWKIVGRCIFMCVLNISINTES